ncbi:ABC transporter permease [Paenibacillus beijingensis]|uniref:Peptide ABC transporter permease n=1 Tax=Paenibacillus beijingensis TaxID=1126833 RepID=A0A0D5NG69_9BACL|nr:ABC transporter permease [Paenibacillus beijingensis]AJY74251.1 peptide ABC transporter permease [Paenibacillus beijingensis]
MKEIWYRFRKNKLALTGFLFIAAFALTALLASLVSPYDPYALGTQMLGAPSAKHWLGTDQLGRDILSRIVYGTRISLHVGAVSVSIALAAGVVMGVLAGYFGGKTDAVISRVVDVLFSIPDILLALAVMAVLGASTTNLMVAIGIVYTPIFARIARGAVLAMRDSLYIEAARSIGVGHLAIMRRHVLPNILGPVIVQVTLSFAFAILSEASLSFLGLGAEPDMPSWGVMLSEGKDWMESAWWIAVFPGIAITLAVLSFNILGDGLRDALDPRASQDA